MYSRILAPLDGSELSEKSLEHVKELAARSSSLEVVLFMVLERVSYLMYASNASFNQDSIIESEKRIQVHAQEYVDKLVNRLKKEGIYAQTVVVWGRPADEICNCAEKNNIDLIVMSTRGQSGVSRWAFGSVADKVIRSSTIPILIIPPHGINV